MNRLNRQLAETELGMDDAIGEIRAYINMGMYTTAQIAAQRLVDYASALSESLKGLDDESPIGDNVAYINDVSS